MTIGRILLVAVGLALPLISSGCLGIAGPVETPVPLTASGTIRALDIRLSSELGGRIQAVNVKEGETVRAGDVLVVLDSTPWELQLLPAEAAVTVAQRDLEVLRAGPRTEAVAASQALLAIAEAERDGVYVAWQNALGLVETPQELIARIVDARSQVALAEQAVELAEAQLAQIQMTAGVKSEGTTERESDDYQVAASERELAAAEADLEAAQALLNQLWRIRQLPLGYIAQANAAEGQYEVAEAAVAVARAELDDLLAGPTVEELAVAEATLRRSEAEASLLRLKIDRCTLTSPIDGVVMAQILEAGELAAPVATLLRLADLSLVRLAVYVPVNQMGRVQLGQIVQVMVDSFPERVFEGRVVLIGDEPEFTPRNVATAEERLNTFYAVEIEIPNAEDLLKPGMPADAQF